MPTAHTLCFLAEGKFMRRLRAETAGHDPRYNGTATNRSSRAACSRRKSQRPTVAVDEMTGVVPDYGIGRASISDRTSPMMRVAVWGGIRSPPSSSATSAANA